MIDYRATDFSEVVRDVDVVLESLGGGAAERSLRTLRLLVTLVERTNQTLASTVTAARYTSKRLSRFETSPPRTPASRAVPAANSCLFLNPSVNWRVVQRSARIGVGCAVMTVIAQLREVVDGVSTLLEQHIRLARLEFAEDARFVGMRVGLIAALAPLILVGYGFMCVALALALRRVMPADLAFLLVGLVNLVGGALGIARIAKQLQGRTVLDASLAELQATATVVRQEASSPK